MEVGQRTRPPDEQRSPAFLVRETMTGFPEEVALQQSLKAGRGRKRKGTAGS